MLALQATKRSLSAGLSIYRSKELQARSFLFDDAIVEEVGQDYGDDSEATKE